MQGSTINKQWGLDLGMNTTIKTPLIAVCGATGAQGSSVAKHLLDNGGYRVRVLTRNVDSEKAQGKWFMSFGLYIANLTWLALGKRGAEVVKCDLGDEEQVASALSGVYAVFGVTNFWEHGEEAEIRQGKNLADSAKACGVKHFIWSSVPRVKGIIMPRHWESKAIVDDYPHALGVPTTTMFTSFYYENIWMFFVPKKLSDGTLLLDWFFPSEGPLPSFAAEDLGGWLMVSLKNPETWIGNIMTICSELLTPRDYAEKLSNGLGTTVTLKEKSYASFEAARPHVSEDVWLNIKAFWEQLNVLGGAVDESR
ncbi:NmrA-like family domain-containing protein 1 [Gallus gallus] [Rhizoctonia solani]|uniref:NmrA-like family domain-containing protein 1 [Gallus gallus] n=1 Tax=Rhizoctonia solani TaxID=456999 RepID=A0A0K6G103_9AGAM|nr:NmrA-like family domain-containing protein 1 [Gallus gallus] [Rhizoctonia solani]